MVDFDYVRVKTSEEAVRILRDHAEARLLAGGQTLIPTLKQRLTRPEVLVDLQDVPVLRGITDSDGGIELGAMTRHADVASSAVIARVLPALTRLAGGIAHPQVRHMGTIGGSIANNDPASDYPAAVVGLDATVQTDRRTIAGEKFFTGLFSTVLEPDEIVQRVRFARAQRAGYCKIANPASGYVTVGVFVAQTQQGVRVAINGASPCVFRQPELERRLTRAFEPQALEGFCQSADGLNSDLHASAAYRAHLVGVAARRALTMALAD